MTAYFARKRRQPDRSFRRHHRHLTTAYDRLARARPGSIRDDRVRPAAVGRAGPFRFRKEPASG
jgi:hypothetical protein